MSHHRKSAEWISNEAIRDFLVYNIFGFRALVKVDSVGAKLGNGCYQCRILSFRVENKVDLVMAVTNKGALGYRLLEIAFVWLVVTTL